MAGLTVQFKAKPQAHGERSYVKVPELKRSHANLDAFRRSRAFGGYANSDMFPQMLRGAVRRVVGGEVIWLDAVPAGVKVEQGGLLASVTIEVPDAR